MVARDDTPALLLRVEAGRLVPVHPLDAETLAGLRIGTIVEAKVKKTPPNPALRGWWQLMGAVVKATDDRWHSPRALSNAMLIRFGCVDAENLVGSGIRHEPMSLREFSEEQLRRMTEIAKSVVETEILPGVDADLLIKESSRGR